RAVDRLARRARQARRPRRAEPAAERGHVEKKTALTGADERGRAGGGLSEAARPFGASRDPFARSPSPSSKRRTGPGAPRFPGIFAARLARQCRALLNRRRFVVLFCAGPHRAAVGVAVAALAGLTGAPYNADRK